MRHLEAIFGATTQEINFALWYLKQRELVVADDKSSLQITVEGMDYLEMNPPLPELVMPMIRAAGLAPQPGAVPEPEPAAEATALPEPEPVIEMPTRPVPSQSAAGSAIRIGDLLARRKTS